MKDRIGTLSYNTETAKKIGEYSSDLPTNDFGYYKETLYKKRTGEYFLAGYGGPKRNYFEIVNGKKVMQSSSTIKPLTFNQAKQWHQDFILDSDYEDKKETEKVYHREFEPNINDKKTVKASLTLTVGAKRKLERIAAKQHISQSQVVENLIEELHINILKVES